MRQRETGREKKGERNRGKMIIWIIICTWTRGKETVPRDKYIYSRHVYFIAKIVSSACKRVEGRPVGIQRVSRRTKSWKYKRFSLALHKSHSRITLPHRRNSNGGFPTPDESNFPGRGWWRALNILSPPPGNFFRCERSIGDSDRGWSDNAQYLAPRDFSSSLLETPVMELKLILCGC